MGNYFKYMRISTKEERGLQKYNRQEKSLTKYAAENNIEYIAEFKEDESGKSFTNRKEWNRLEKLLKSGDTIVFKDISRFTREAENGYKKYMQLLDNGIDLIFIDNPTISTEYIKQLLSIAKEQSLVAKVSLENTIKLLLLVELDRVEQERKILIDRITSGIAASSKTQGRQQGQLDKMTDDLKEDIEKFLKDRSIKQVDILKKHTNISRNTLSKYIKVVQQQQEQEQQKPKARQEKRYCYVVAAFYREELQDEMPINEEEIYLNYAEAEKAVERFKKNPDFESVYITEEEREIVIY